MSRRFLKVILFFGCMGIIVGCQVSTSEHGQISPQQRVDPQLASPEIQDLKLGSSATPGINQFVLIKHPGGPLTRHFDFSVPSRGRVLIDKKDGTLVFSGCNISAGDETLFLQTLDNGQIKNSMVMTDPRGERVEPNVKYRLSYSFSELGSCPKIIATFPAIFEPETVAKFGPLDLSLQENTIAVGDSSPFEVLLKFTAQAPTMLTPTFARSGAADCRYSLEENWSFARSTEGSQPETFKTLEDLSDQFLKTGETLWLKMKGSGSEACPTLKYSFSASSLTATEASFSQIFSIPASAKTAQLSNAKSIGCANSEEVIYFDLGLSNLSTRDARLVNGFGANRKDLTKKTHLIDPAYLNFDPSTQGLKGLSIVVHDLDKSEEYWRANLTLVSEQWMLAVDNMESRDSPVSSGSFFCELYDQPVIAGSAPSTNSAGLQYECEGLERFRILFKRPFGGQPLIEYHNPEVYFGRPSACSEYFNSMPIRSTEVITPQRRSFSTLEWATINGVLQYTDTVHYKEYNSPFSYSRHLESPAWRDVIGANPPESFTITRTDDASWYYQSDSTCKDDPAHRSSYSCKKVP